MPNDCYGPSPLRVFKKYVEKIESIPHYQYELFSCFEEEMFDYDKLSFFKKTWYNFLPYTYALDVISSYEEQAS